MSTQLVCDDCGEEIDEASTYVSATVVHKQLIDGVMQTGATQQLDWHAEHAPIAVSAEPE
jgi:hypothetical protein